MALMVLCSNLAMYCRETIYPTTIPPSVQYVRGETCERITNKLTDIIWLTVGFMGGM